MGDNLSSLTLSIPLMILSAFAAFSFIFFFSSQSPFETLNHLIAFLSIFFSLCFILPGIREGLGKPAQAVSGTADL